MMTRTRTRVALPLLALALAACGGGGEDEQNPPSDTTAAAVTAPADTTPTASAAATVTDPQIAAIVVNANAVDSTAGELAKQKGTNAQVKEFANRMVTDHGGVNKQAVALVTKLGVTPEENETSRGLAQGGQQAHARLSGLTGAEFDRAYIENEISYHQTVLDAIDKTLIPSAQNAELKALLEQVRPAVAAHLEHARQVQAQLGGS